MPIDPSDIADLTTLIFAAALNPALWIDFLEHLRKLSGGVRTHIIGRDMATRRLFGQIGAGYDESHVAEYERYYCHMNVWVDKFAPSSSGTYMPVAAMFPLEKLFKTEFYQDWVKPQDDMYGGGGIMLFNEQSRFLAFGGHIRAKDRDGLERDFERLIRMLTPHVQQAFEINRALEGKAVSDFLVNITGKSSTGILLLRYDGRLLFANQAAQDWISVGTPIQIDALGRLRSNLPGIAEFLAAVLVTIEDIEHIEDTASAQFRTLSVDGKSELLLRTARFIPDRQIKSPFGILHSGDDRGLLLTIEVKPFIGLDAIEVLRRCRLTAAEIEVALDLANGARVAEIAERRQVSVNTIRNQRHSILSKLELRSQSQLARLIFGRAKG